MPANGLTPREHEVLAAMAQGLTNQGIAHRLGLRRQTVNNYSSQIYRKLGVRSRVEAVLLAERRGWLRDKGGFR